MSGKSNPEPPSSESGNKQRKRSQADDRCDLVFDVDLSAVQPEPLKMLQRGSVLDVALIEQGNFDAVVCRRPIERDIIGSLAAFEGLDELINCIRGGNVYAAAVTQIGASNCRVHVKRAAK